MVKINERTFQTFIKDCIRAEGGYVTQIHPGIGADTGLPDLMTAVESVGLLPLELKIGNIETDNRTIWCSAIRPSQIRWHSELTSHGYLSCILIGIANGRNWRIFAVDGMRASKVKDGFIINEDATELDARLITSELDNWAEINSYTFD